MGNDQDIERLYGELATLLEEEGKEEEWIPVHARAMRAANNLSTQDATMMFAALHVAVEYDKQIKKRLPEQRPFDVYNKAIKIIKAICEKAEQGSV